MNVLAIFISIFAIAGLAEAYLLAYTDNVTNEQALAFRRMALAAQPDLQNGTYSEGMASDLMNQMNKDETFAGDNGDEKWNCMYLDQQDWKYSFFVWITNLYTKNVSIKNEGGQIMCVFTEHWIF